MTRSFADRADAEAYMAAVSPTSVRMMSTCEVCGQPCAVSVTAGWLLTPDLLGGWHVDPGPEVYPIADPCGHGVRIWRLVNVTPNPGRPCGRGCREASSASCNCACGGKNHGLIHRPNP